MTSKDYRRWIIFLTHRPTFIYQIKIAEVEQFIKKTFLDPQSRVPTSVQTKVWKQRYHRIAKYLTTPRTRPLFSRSSNLTFSYFSVPDVYLLTLYSYPCLRLEHRRQLWQLIHYVRTVEDYNRAPWRSVKRSFEVVRNLTQGMVSLEFRDHWIWIRQRPLVQKPSAWAWLWDGQTLLTTDPRALTWDEAFHAVIPASVQTVSSACWVAQQGPWIYVGHPGTTPALHLKNPQEMVRISKRRNHTAMERLLEFQEWLPILHHGVIHYRNYEPLVVPASIGPIRVYKVKQTFLKDASP